MVQGINKEVFMRLLVFLTSFLIATSLHADEDLGFDGDLYSETFSDFYVKGGGKLRGRVLASVSAFVCGYEKLSAEIAPTVSDYWAEWFVYKRDNSERVADMMSKANAVFSEREALKIASITRVVHLLEVSNSLEVIVPDIDERFCVNSLKKALEYKEAND
jgi:hypothetical protein